MAAVDSMGDSRRGQSSGKRGKGSSSAARALSNGDDVLANVSLRDVATTAKVAFDVAKEAIAMLNPEEKVYEVVSTSASCSALAAGVWAGANTNPFAAGLILDQPAQGDGENQRSGDSIEGKGIELRLSAAAVSGQTNTANPGTVSSQSTSFRFIVIQDTGAGARVTAGGQESIAAAGTALFNDLLALYAAQGSSAWAYAAWANFTSAIEYEYKPQYRVLLDEIVNIDPTAGGMKFWEREFKIPHKQVKMFADGTQTTADISTQLLVMTFCPTTGTWNTTSATGGSYSAFSRFRYIDN